MTARHALHRAVLALGVTGSLVPGLPPASPVEAPRAVLAVAAPAASTATARSGPDAAQRRTWSWPLTPRPRVLAAFVPPRSTWGAGHRGIDLAARQGQSVLAVDRGVVSHVGVIAGRGTVSVTHPSGLRSTYEPVRAAVATGVVVAEGAVLGVVTGRTHCGGSCLHLGALDGRAYVDPRTLLGGGPVVLLPLTPDR